jgi:hypothetical protein
MELIHDHSIRNYERTSPEVAEPIKEQYAVLEALCREVVPNLVAPHHPQPVSNSEWDHYAHIPTVYHAQINGRDFGILLTFHHDAETFAITGIDYIQLTCLDGEMEKFGIVVDKESGIWQRKISETPNLSVKDMQLILENVTGQLQRWILLGMFEHKVLRPEFYLHSDLGRELVRNIVIAIAPKGQGETALRLLGLLQ